MTKLFGGVLLSLCLMASSSCAAWADGATDRGPDVAWNSAEIRWFGYEDGLMEARSSRKRLIIVFYTDWCPHCRKYGAIFKDDKVVKMAENFVMVRVNRDDSEALNARYDVDGGYVPRTMVAKSDGTLIKELTSGYSDYAYYLDTERPDELLAFMSRALK